MPLRPFESLQSTIAPSTVGLFAFINSEHSSRPLLQRCEHLDCPPSPPPSLQLSRRYALRAPYCPPTPTFWLMSEAHTAPESGTHLHLRKSSSPIPTSTCSRRWFFDVFSGHRTASCMIFRFSSRSIRPTVKTPDFEALALRSGNLGSIPR